MKMKVLDLVLKGKWYDLIDVGNKREEYREIKPYWYIRLFQRTKKYARMGRISNEDAEYACSPDVRVILKEGFLDCELKPYTHVRFRRGYTSISMLWEMKNITIGKGKPEWGATDKEVFIIRLGERVEN